MSHDDDKVWSAGLSHLLEAERRNVTAPDEAEERVWGRVATVLGPGGGGPGGDRGGGEPGRSDLPPRGAGSVGPRGAASRWLGSTKAMLGVYALGIVTGVVGATLATRANVGRVAPLASASSTEVPRVERETVPPAPLAAQAGTADAEVATRPHPSPVPAPWAPRLAPSSERSLEAERKLLDPARAALGRGDGVAALAATDVHLQRYPQGALAEEREAIAIQALLLVARYDSAREREAAFEQKYPRSMLLQAVRASVQSIP